MNLYKFLKVGGKIRHWSFLAELLHVHARPKLIDPPNLFSIWIGGKRNGNSFQWIDGSPFDYDIWGVKLPDNEGGNENCMEFSAYLTFGHLVVIFCKNC